MPFRQCAAWIVLLLPGFVRADPPAFDRHGDPLPPGAIARLGTMRFRHGDQIKVLAFAPDGKTIVSGGQDKTICVWEASSGRRLRTLTGHASSIHFATFSSAGRLLASMDDNGELRVWTVASGELLYQLNNLTRLAPTFSADGKVLAVCDDKAQVHVLDAVTGQERKTLPPRTAPTALALAPDARVVACGEGGTVRLYDVATGKKIRTYEGQHSTVKELAFSPDGTGLASGGEGGDVGVWEIGSEDAVWSAKLAEDAAVVGLRFLGAPRELHVVTLDGLVTRFNAATGKKLAQLGEKDEDQGSILTLSPDGKRLALGQGRSVLIRDLATGQDNPALGQQSSFGSVGWSPVPGKTGPLAALATSKSLLLWEPTSPDGPRSLVAPNNDFVASFSADGKWVASSSPESVLRLWNTATGEVGRELKLTTERACPVGFSPAGPTLALECGDRLLLLDPDTGKERLTIPNTRIAYPCPGFSASGRILAALTPNQDALRIWEATTGKERGRVPLLARAACLALAPDGTTVAVGDTAGGIQIYHLGREKLLRQFPGHELCVRALAYAPGGKLLASGSQDRTIRLWDVATGRELRRLEGHVSDVDFLAFSPDGKFLLSASGDETALAWDVAKILAIPAETNPAPKPKPRPAADLWADLASPDGRKAFAAIGELTDRPAEAIPLLQARLKPVARVEAGAIARLLADLESDAFEKRDAALKELRRLDRLAEAQVRAALEGKPTPETRRLLDELVAGLESPLADPEQLRALRAVEVLETLGTPEARTLLDALTRGATAARLTEEARAAADRLRRAALPR